MHQEALSCTVTDDVSTRSLTCATATRGWYSCNPTAKLKQLRWKLDGELSDVRNTLMKVSGIALPSPVPGSSVLSRTVILKKELLKEAVVNLKLVESTAELLSQRIRVRVAQLRGTFSPAPQSSFFWVLCINGLHLSWGTALSEQAEDEEFPGP